MKVAVIVFPGSNCDSDLHYVLQEICHTNVNYVAYTETSLSEYDAVILPGGFSYGDYLRCGAIASLTPIMRAVKRFAYEGKPVIGICNGFQILTEAQLLPGVLKKNDHLKFVCKDVELIVENCQTPFTNKYEHGQKILLPIAHMDGNYFASNDVIEKLEKNNQIVLRYSSENPNGSLNNIAGICNERGNVIGMMPHPERASDKNTGSVAGLNMFKSLLHQG